VTALYYSGVFVAAAAGNEAQDACNSSPASSLGATTVAASGLFQFPLGNPEDEPTSFTNYGTCVDLFAIGSKVKSTFLNGTVKTLSGTSMASPAVAGVAAIKLSINPSKSAASLRSDILNDATANVVCCYNNGTPNRLLYKSPSI
jgi:subtilisin family serine protease